MNELTNKLGLYNKEAKWRQIFLCQYIHVYHISINPTEERDLFAASVDTRDDVGGLKGSPNVYVIEYVRKLKRKFSQGGRELWAVYCNKKFYNNVSFFVGVTNFF